MWTDERVELLKKLWADGLSASRIAAELGGITRNAVIGKVHRLGLSGRAKTPSSSVSRPRKARSSSHLFRGMRAAVRGNTALAPAYELIGVVTGPIQMKAALNLLGHDVGGLRLPMVEASEEETAQIRSCLERLKLLEPSRV